MTVAERRRYVLRAIANHLRGGEWFGYAPLTGTGASTAPVPGAGLAWRLRTAPAAARSAWIAAGEN